MNDKRVLVTNIGLTWVIYLIENAAFDPLYVGCTSNLERRLGEHARRWPWWAEAHRVVILLMTRDRDRAFSSEASFIDGLSPIHNIQHNRRVA
jgi:predicted GIY-YIG superfamily endonuclease